jgi:hypothetical protein
MFVVGSFRFEVWCSVVLCCVVIRLAGPYPVVLNRVDIVLGWDGQGRGSVV